MQTREQYEQHYGLLQETAEAEYRLFVFGDVLAEREGYQGVTGIEAVHLYLIRKYGWLPKDVKAMNFSDLSLALTVEQANWLLPEVARVSEGRSPL